MPVKSKTENPMSVLRQQIQNGTFSPVYIFTGSEDYLTHQFEKDLCQALLPDEDEMNQSVYTGPSSQPESIAADIRTMPFLAEHRVVILRDTGFLKKGSPVLEEVIPLIPTENVLIFCEHDIDKRTRLYKQIRKSGTILTFEAPSEPMLLKWLTGRLSATTDTRTGEKISFALQNSVPSALYTAIGKDMYRLASEAEKLQSYCYERRSITLADVHLLVETRITDKIFDFCDAVGSGKRENAIRLYSELLLLPDAKPERILSMIKRHYNILLQVAEIRKTSPEKSGSAASLIGIPSFTLRRYEAQCRFYTPEQLIRIVNACEEAEFQYKSGQTTAKPALERLIINLLTPQNQA